ncbi:MAG: transposase [Thermoplasmata archaeon M8B2D]|nr:MAG: transposase [Thermoplasmata archaeon M8B2D]
MREVIHQQLNLGETGIPEIEIDLKSRDDIPQVLLGLQYIYETPKLRKKVFSVLEKILPEKINKENGRPGMELWRIFVMGVLRVNLNWDYDRLCEMANQHRNIRKMLGHGGFDDDFMYTRRTIINNVSLFTPEVLDEINQIVVKAGHDLVKKKDEELKGKCDSFVVETDVHYPTDINLLFDASRKVIQLIAELCDKYNVPGWRQYQYNIKQVKKAFRKAQQSKRSNSKDETKRNKLIAEAHKTYIELANSFIEKAIASMNFLRQEYGSKELLLEIELLAVNKFVEHANRQIDQINRRVIKGESIPHHEKVFSIFEEHTEWINKGKQGVPVELGLKVCILSDQHHFILHHRVMQKEVDTKIAVPIVQEAQNKFYDLNACSFDKGFYSPLNQQDLSNILDLVVLPKKGYLSAERKAIENADEFKLYKRKHSGVESDINAIEVHGLDRCLDHGIDGFRRYVALAVAARNIQQVGVIIKKRKLKQQNRKTQIENTS